MQYGYYAAEFCDDGDVLMREDCYMVCRNRRWVDDNGLAGLRVTAGWLAIDHGVVQPSEWEED